MATIAIPAPLTLEEFHTRYAGSGRAYEFWFGEVVEKAMPAWLHSLVQGIVTEMLRRAGYRAAPGVRTPHRPSVRTPRRYQCDPASYSRTLSDCAIADRNRSRSFVSRRPMTRVYAKCRHYETLGIAQVFVVDPQTRTVWEWNTALGHLDRKTAWLLTNGQRIALSDVWSQFDTELSK
jgi:Uma2 family endonuclease